MEPISDSDRAKLARVAKYIPVLSTDLHKGQCGRVGVIGGSKNFTGAPYFCATSALKAGSDLVYVFTDQSAAPVIKGYSPDLMVVPFDDDGKFKVEARFLSKLHAMVIGPGLGTSIDPFGPAIIADAISNGMYIVLDAEAIGFIGTDSDLLNYPKLVITPNKVEFDRLLAKNGFDNLDCQGLSHAMKDLMIVRKGKHDVISDGKITEVVSNSGGLKRCGGQGDILAGLIGAFLAWIHIYEHSKEYDGTPQRDMMMHAVYAACWLAREVGKRTYGVRGRSMQASDILGEIGPVFDTLFET